MRIFLFALFVLILPVVSMAQSDSIQNFYDVSLVPNSVESSEVKPRLLSEDEILHLKELQDENKIIVVDLDLYTRVTIYPKNRVKIQTIEE